MKKKLLNCLGMMSGTSMDGVDISLIKTDGENFFESLTMTKDKRRKTKDERQKTKDKAGPPRPRKDKRQKTKDKAGPT